MPSLRILKENESQTHFLTFTIIDWINIFTKLEYYEVLINSLKFCCEHKGFLIYGYVIMTNHMHIIAQNPKEDLSSVVASFKRFTTWEILELLRYDNRKYILKLLSRSSLKKKGYENQIWQKENYPELIENEDFFHQKLDYIHEIPVKGGYIDYEEEWRYSSARNYYKDDHSVIKVVTDSGAITDNGFN